MYECVMNMVMEDDGHEPGELYDGICDDKCDGTSDAIWMENL